MTQKSKMDRLAEHLAWLDEHRGNSRAGETLSNQDALSTMKVNLDDLEQAISQAMESPAEWEFEKDVYFQRALSFSEDLVDLRLLESPRAISSVDDRVGIVFGNYRIDEFLAQGGMGAVYRATHTSLDRVVALKTLTSSRLNHRKSIARFQREMKAVGRLNHPNIVKALDAGEVDGVHYIAMELVDGIDLSTLLKRSGTLAIPDACEIIRQAAEGLQYIHEKGLVHRDIKPSNIMLTRDGKVKILDLGLAHVSGLLEGDELTRTGQVMGTLDYMAPEQSLDAGKVDIRADIFSLGVTFYKLLTGESPYGKQSFSNLLKKMRAILQDQLPSIRVRCPELPKPLVSIIDRMLVKEVKRRFDVPEILSAELSVHCKGAELKKVAFLAMDSFDSVAKAHFQPITNSLTRQYKYRGIAFALFVCVMLLMPVLVERAQRPPQRPVSQENQFPQSDVESAKSTAGNEALSQPLFEEASLPAFPEDAYWEIEPLPGTDRIEPEYFHEEILTVVGTSLDTVGNTHRGFLWTPDKQTFEPWDTKTTQIQECLGMTKDGRQVLCRSFMHSLRWEEDKGFLNLNRLNYFLPEKYCVSSHEFVGVIPVKGKFKQLGKLRIVDKFQESKVQNLGTPDADASMRLVDANNDGSTVIIQTVNATRDFGGDYWIWTEERGFSPLPPSFLPGSKLTTISESGNMVVGVTPAHELMIHNCSEGIGWKVPDSQGRMSHWISNDGSIVFGSKHGGDGWVILPNAPGPQPLMTLLRSRYSKVIPQKLVVPKGISSSGGYLWGILDHASQAQVVGWVLSTETVHPNFDQFWEESQVVPLNAKKDAVVTNIMPKVSIK